MWSLCYGKVINLNSFRGSKIYMLMDYLVGWLVDLFLYWSCHVCLIWMTMQDPWGFEQLRWIGWTIVKKRSLWMKRHLLKLIFAKQGCLNNKTTDVIWRWFLLCVITVVIGVKQWFGIVFGLLMAKPPLGQPQWSQGFLLKRCLE